MFSSVFSTTLSVLLAWLATSITVWLFIGLVGVAVGGRAGAIPLAALAEGGVAILAGAILISGLLWLPAILVVRRRSQDARVLATMMAPLSALALDVLFNLYRIAKFDDAQFGIDWIFVASFAPIMMMFTGFFFAFHRRLTLPSDAK